MFGRFRFFPKSPVGLGSVVGGEGAIMLMGSPGGRGIVTVEATKLLGRPQGTGGSVISRV